MDASAKGVTLLSRKCSQVAHHFAHAHKTGCSGETVAHLLGKQIFSSWFSRGHFNRTTASSSLELSKLEQGTRQRFPRPCSDNSDGDQPGPLDLNLLNSAGRLIAMMEVVVTHAPEEGVFRFAADHRVPVFEFHISTAECKWQLRAGDPLRGRCRNRCLQSICPDAVHLSPSATWR